jgi:hypothetical protein
MNVDILNWNKKWDFKKIVCPTPNVKTRAKILLHIVKEGIIKKNEIETHI